MFFHFSLFSKGFKVKKQKSTSPRKSIPTKIKGSSGHFTCHKCQMPKGEEAPVFDSLMPWLDHLELCHGDYRGKQMLKLLQDERKAMAAERNISKEEHYRRDELTHLKDEAWVERFQFPYGPLRQAATDKYMFYQGQLKRIQLDKLRRVLRIRQINLDIMAL